MQKTFTVQLKQATLMYNNTYLKKIYIQLNLSITIGKGQCLKLRNC